MIHRQTGGIPPVLPDILHNALFQQKPEEGILVSGTAHTPDQDAGNTGTPPGQPGIFAKKTGAAGISGRQQDSTRAAADSVRNSTDQPLHKLVRGMLTAEHLRQNPAVADFFSSLHLPPDNLSLGILSFMQQMEKRPDAAQLQRIRRTAAHHAGQEETAAETAALLEEKGIVSDERSSAQLLAQLALYCGAARDSDGHRSKHGNGQTPQQTEPELLPEDPLLSALYSGALPDDATHSGILTLANHCTGGSLHWLLFPFEFDTGAAPDTQTAHGSIRILCDTRQKTVKKIAVSAVLDTAQLHFVLDFPHTVRFSAEPELSKNSRKKYTEILREVFKNSPWTDIMYDDTINASVFFDAATPVLLAGGVQK